MVQISPLLDHDIVTCRCFLLEECGIHLGGVGTLDGDGFGPGEAACAHISLETNGPDGDGVVAMSSVDAEVMADVVYIAG